MQIDNFDLEKYFEVKQYMYFMRCGFHANNLIFLGHIMMMLACSS